MFIADPIHLIVEDLASRIKRSVAVDDAALNYIAHSTHRFSDEDQIRLQSITERQLPEPILSYITSMNLASIHEPLVIPATHQHGFDNDRLLVPCYGQHITRRSLRKTSKHVSRPLGDWLHFSNRQRIHQIAS